MATGSRIRKAIDFGRLRHAMEGPTADTRTWMAIARVDSDPDAIQFLDGYGWVADVTITSGQLSGEGPIPCRVMTPFGASGEGTSCPVALGAEVVLAIPDGNANVQPVIIGYLHNPTIALPTSVNGNPVNESTATTTVFAKTESSLNAEFGPTARISAANQASLEAPNIRIADENATQPYVRGNDLQTATNQLVTALNTYASALGAGAPASPVLIGTASAAATALATALGSFASAITAALSTRIRGE